MIALVCRSPFGVFGVMILLGLCLRTLPAQAQIPTDGWAFTGVFTYIGLIDSNFQLITTTPGAAGGGDIAADSNGGTGFYTTRTGLVQVSYDPSNPPYYFTALGNLTMPGQGGVCVDTAREWVYFWDLGNQQLSCCRKGVWNQSSVVLANPQASGIGGRVRDICTNGRELFFSIDVSANDAFHIFALDIQDPTHPIRPLMMLPIGASVRPGPTLALARDGEILAMDDPWLYRIDPASGTSTQIAMHPFQLSPGWLGLPINMGYNPWTDTVAITPSDETYGLFGPAMVVVARPLSSNGPWQTVFSYLLGAHGLTALVVQPFELFGMGCRNGTGRDPRLGWRGLPQEGQSFSITLRDAEPNGFAFFWLGLSDTYWAGVGTLPFDAAPFGAPGCLLRVSADVPFPVAVDANGHAALQQSVPVNPALRGLQVFAQTASSSTTNPFGFSASDALVIRVR